MPECKVCACNTLWHDPLMSEDDKRTRARTLAAQALAEGKPVAWFEQLYREAGAGEAIVPWDDPGPSPLLVRWLDAHAPAPGSTALDVGCGTGINAAELARRGLDVIAFDVSPTAVELARARVAALGSTGSISFATADVLDLPSAWRHAFALVVEVNTLQVLPRELRAPAARQLAEAVAPGGTLLVIARGRDETDPEGPMPWPLLRAEIEAIAMPWLPLVELEDVLDDETPPVRRFVAHFQRSRET
jgi:SAM-dependent methyltransferase